MSCGRIGPLVGVEVRSDMRCGQSNKASTPFPTLVMVAGALPTFHMLLGGIALALWAVGGLLAGALDEPSTPLKQFAYPALYAAAILAPVYLLWIALTKRLNSKEKVRWAIVVVALNLIGMPAFYAFMARRYLRNRRQPAVCPGATAAETPVETETDAEAAQ